MFKRVKATASAEGLGAKAPVAVVAMGVLALGILPACTSAPPEIALTGAAAEGRDIARGSGCAACHGRNGEGGVAPTWKGLAGSTVSFENADSAVADSAYLTQSIIDPSAQIREGFALKMPENNLNEEEVANVVAYIEALR